jgi:Caspase domain
VNDQDYAIVVGINQYPRLPVLHAALADATRFAEWLKLPTGGGLPEGNVKLICGPETLPPTGVDMVGPIQEQIDDHLSQIGVELNQRIGRRLYFYFAGHGFGPSFDEVGMLMAHASQTLLKRNIGLARYRRYFREHALFDEVIFIVDCCRDRAGGIETAGPEFTVAADGPVGRVLDLTIMAAAYGEKAFEVRSDNGTAIEPRGLLTTAVLEGLQSPDAADAAGRFTSLSLAAYVKRRVPELAVDAKMRQAPDVDPPDSEIVFGMADIETTLVRILAPPDLAGDLVLLDDAMVEMERRSAADATIDRPPWLVTLDRNRFYVVRRTAVPRSTRPDIIEPLKLEGPNHVFTVTPGG